MGQANTIITTLKAITNYIYVNSKDSECLLQGSLNEKVPLAKETTP